MESLKERFFDYFGLDEGSYRQLVAPLSFSSLPYIDENPLTKKVLSRLALAKERREKVLIYGDYDCDGVMSTSILLCAFRKFGLDAAGFLPSRYLDGYGLNVSNVLKIKEKGYSLIVTSDNGVTAHEALSKAKELGIETIVLDHHEFDSKEIETPYVLHPVLLEYGHQPISAGFLAFLLSQALLKEVDPYLLTLGAVSTLSDAMPLKGENRNIVRLALDILNKERYPEFTLLTDSAFFSEATLQFEIVPKINAVGRLEKEHHLNRLLPYFGRTTNNREALAKYLNDTNEKRRAIAKEAASKLEINVEEPSFSILSDIPEGLNGLLASKVLGLYQKPVAVFSKKDGTNDVLIGSIRAPEGFDVMDAFEKMSISFLTKGGHTLAAGCSIKENDFPLFKKEFAFYALKNKFLPKKERTIPLTLGEVNEKTYRFLRTFAPFGEGFKAPRFLLTGLDPKTFTYMKGGKYLSMLLGEARILSFTISEDSFDLSEKANLVGSFRENVFHGKRNLELLVEKAL